MQNGKYTARELPTRQGGPSAPLRRKVGSLVIESTFEVTDDILRSAKDDVFNVNFRPTLVEVHIELDTGHYWVALSGPCYSDGTPPIPAQGRAVFPGVDFLDADQHFNSLVVDGVIGCLAEHGKVA